MTTTATHTIAPSRINPESYDVVSSDGTRLGTISRDICDGRIMRGAYTLAPDAESAGFAGRYDSVEEAADAVAATWPAIEQPAEETPDPAAADTKPTRTCRFRRIRAAIARLFGHHTTATTAPEMEDSYDHPGIAYHHLAHHADTAYDQATTHR